MNFKKPFFSKWEDLDQEKYLILDYYFESTIDPYEAAAHLCQEQSTAQWTKSRCGRGLKTPIRIKSH